MSSQPRPSRSYLAVMQPQLKLVSGTVTVLSTSSPLAAQLRDSEAGDALEVEIGGRVIEVEIIAID